MTTESQKPLQSLESATLAGKLVVPENIKYLQGHPEALQALQDLVALYDAPQTVTRLEQAKQDAEVFNDPEVQELNAAIKAEVNAEYGLDNEVAIAKEKKKRGSELKALLTMLNIREAPTLEEKEAKKSRVKEAFRNAAQSADQKLQQENQPIFDPHDVDSINQALERLNNPSAVEPSLEEQLEIARRLSQSNQN